MPSATRPTVHTRRRTVVAAKSASPKQGRAPRPSTDPFMEITRIAKLISAKPIYLILCAVAVLVAADYSHLSTAVTRVPILSENSTITRFVRSNLDHVAGFVIFLPALYSFPQASWPPAAFAVMLALLVFKPQSGVMYLAVSAGMLLINLTRDSNVRLICVSIIAVYVYVSIF